VLHKGPYEKLKEAYGFILPFDNFTLEKLVACTIIIIAIKVIIWNSIV
jgi:hypothetical protein